jgi:hypothetical protein
LAVAGNSTGKIWGATAAAIAAPGDKMNAAVTARRRNIFEKKKRNLLLFGSNHPVVGEN